jgi:hypothetical protein
MSELQESGRFLAKPAAAGLPEQRFCLQKAPLS